MNNADVERVQNDEFLTLDQIPLRYPAFTKGSLKWLRFNGESNGFNTCIRKLGKKCVVSIRAFEAWVNQQKG